MEYQLVRSKRKTIAIHIKLNGDVFVRAPIRVSEKQIAKFVGEKADWITKKQAEFATHAKPQANCSYEAGASWQFLGWALQLEIELGICDSVQPQDGKLLLQTPKPRNQKHVQKILDNWFWQQAEQIFAQRMQTCLPIAAKIGLEHSGEFAIKNFKTRWGSCSSSGAITLNLQLVHVPQICIDYVILHELCHLREMNHSPAFYALLAKLMPNFRAIKKQLNQEHSFVL